MSAQPNFAEYLRKAAVELSAADKTLGTARDWLVGWPEGRATEEQETQRRDMLIAILIAKARIDEVRPR